MYLSIGNDMAVRDRSIIGIFDLDNTSTSKRTREFLDKAEMDGEVVPCDDLPKSFVLTSEYGFTRVRLTSLNPATLEKGWAWGWKKKNWIKSDKKPALNPDLWDVLLSLTMKHELHYHWVKGHATNPKNNRCDELAVSEWKKLKG